jgi:hypothetical protein
MRFLLLLALIGAVFWALRRSLGEQRQARLAQLGLPGRWRREGGHELVLEGGLGGGPYRERRPDGSTVTGQWRLKGEHLLLRPEAKASEEMLELRVFGSDRLGLHGKTRKNHLYDRVG